MYGSTGTEDSALTVRLKEHQSSSNSGREENFNHTNDLRILECAAARKQAMCDTMMISGDTNLRTLDRRLTNGCTCDPF